MPLTDHDYNQQVQTNMLRSTPADISFIGSEVVYQPADASASEYGWLLRDASRAVASEDDVTPEGWGNPSPLGDMSYDVWLFIFCLLTLLVFRRRLKRRSCRFSGSSQKRYHCRSNE